MGTSPLSIDVYVAPMRRYTCPDQLGEGEVATWAPSSSTLISGPTEGILIDALLTFENADQIAACEALRQEDRGCLHHPRPLGPLARPRAASPALPRGSRVRGSGGESSRRLGGGVQQENEVLDVALPGRAPRGTRATRGAEHRRDPGGRSDRQPHTRWSR